MAMFTSNIILECVDSHFLLFNLKHLTNMLKAQTNFSMDIQAFHLHPPSSTASMYNILYSYGVLSSYNMKEEE